MLVTSPDGYAPLVSITEWPAPDVSPTWLEFKALLDSQRDRATDESAARALEYALRAAALETGAIEGLYTSSRGVTRTVALQGAMWEAALEEIGPDVRGHFEAQLDALDHVLELARQDAPVTEVWIRQLHEITCRNQDTYPVTTPLGVQQHELAKGSYKVAANHVVALDGTLHMYCPPDDVPDEMARYIRQLSSEDFAVRSPIVQAAYAHYAFVAIHPFADGNGRVARALASVFLYRAAGVPLVIFADQQERYWDVLRAADVGAALPLIRFVEDRGLDTMAMMSTKLREAADPAGTPTDALRRLLTAHGGLSFAEVEAVGQRLTAELQSELQRIAAKDQLADVTTSLRPTERPISHAFGRPYHALGWGGSFTVRLDCREPAKVDAEIAVVVGVADSPNAHFALIAVDSRHPDLRPLLLRIEDLHPATSTSAGELITGWAQEAFDEATNEILEKLKRALGKKGFTTDV